jgi:hypothetical protein
MDFHYYFGSRILESGAGRGDLAISAIIIWNKMS